MKSPRYLLATFALFLLPVRSLAEVAPRTALPRSTPEAQGMASSGILAFVEALDQVDALHSLMIVRHGHVVTEGWWTPYQAKTRHELYSLSKSFTSTAVGLAVAEGKLSVDDGVLKFFPDDAPVEPSANLKAMRVRDLLTMSTGHQDESPSGARVMSPKTFLAHPVPHKPGAHFKYNTPATFMQSAIVQRVTGQNLLDFLGPRLFQPLGITSPTWDENFQGISLGGYGLKVRTEDIAKFGQLYLQKGRWHGKQLLPAAWVEAATAKQTSNGSNPKSDWDQGYGYQFWRCRPSAVYRGDGAFGQYCLVLPEQDAVIVITSGVKDMQAILNLVWDQLLPSMQPKRLRQDAAAQRALVTRLGKLSVRQPLGAATTPRAPQLSERRYQFAPNDQKLEAITLIPDPVGTGYSLGIWANEVESRLAIGLGQWRRGYAGFGFSSGEPVATMGAWTSEDTWLVKICAYETPYYQTWKFRFDGDRVYLNCEANVGFGTTQQPPLVGEAR